MLPGALVRVDVDMLRGDLCLLSSPACRPQDFACWLPRGGLAVVVALVGDALLLLGPEGLGWTQAGPCLVEA